MADGPKVAPADPTQTRPAAWPEASARLPGADAPGPRTGDRVGRYLVEARLGAGGMGVVVLARDPELARQVALKVVRRGLGDAAYRERLLREARAMAQLDHPNVVRVHDAGLADGELFVAMEYVPGETLGAWMKHARRPWRQVVARFLAAGRGLAAAHAAGLVHRDFKPDNVLVRTSDGRVAVSDFGLAAPVRDAGADAGGLITIPDPRPIAGEPAPISGDAALIAGDAAPIAGDAAPIAGDAAPIAGDDSTIAAPRSHPDDAVAVVAQPSPGSPLGAHRSPDSPLGAHRSPDSPLGAADLTRTGAIIGTPAYMAPEQIGGMAVDARADLYSFCVALHEAIFGQRPFTLTPLPGGGFARGPARAPIDERRAPAALRKAIARGLASDPADRWPAMAPLLDALTGLLSRRRRRIVAATVGLATAALGVAAFALITRQPTDSCADRAGEIASVWGPPQREATRAALLGSALPYAPQAARNAIDSLDQWAQSWHDVRLDACRSAERDVMPAAEASARAECLERLLASSSARIRVLQTAAPDVVERALDIVTLPDATSCTAGTFEAPPSDPQTAAAVASMRTELAAIDLLIAHGNRGEALSRLRALSDRAHSVGFEPVSDDVERAIIDVELTTEEVTPTTAATARALAERYSARGQDRTVDDLWRDVLATKRLSGGFEGLDETASAARVAARRIHDLARELRTEIEIGMLLHAAGRTKDARTVCAAALRPSEGLRGEVLLQALQCLAVVSSDDEDLSATLSFAERALAEAVVRFGPGHPSTLAALGNVATVQEHRGNDYAALLLREYLAPAIAERSGPESGAHAGALADLAMSYMTSGDRPLARATIDRAAGIVEGLTDDDQRKLFVRNVRAYILQLLGDSDEAIQESLAIAALMERIKVRGHRRAVTIINLTGQLGAAHRCAEALPIADRAIEDLRAELAPTMMLFLEAARANCRSELGQQALAARDLDAAWRRIDPAQIPPEQRGMVEATLANALAHSGGPRDRTMDLALRARQDLASSPQSLPPVDGMIRALKAGYFPRGHPLPPDAASPP